MKRNISRTILAAAVLSLGLTSCKETWLMYDLDQKDKLYFEEKAQVHTYSFALLDSDELTVSTTVKVMGNISDRDRTFEVEPIDVKEGETFMDSTMVSAVEGEDYELGALVIPAGATEGALNITLKRTAKMLESYVRVGLRLKADDNFDVAATDSTASSAILGHDYYCYVNDGEPACPTWWFNSKGNVGWNVYWGKYSPMKFRKLLALLKETELTSPVFYQYCVDSFGEYLDAEPSDKNNSMNNFWISCSYQSAWTKYVRIPLYDYFVEYYKEHPDDPYFEQMGDEYVNMKSYTGWGNPHSGTYAGIQ